MPSENTTADYRRKLARLDKKNIDYKNFEDVNGLINSVKTSKRADGGDISIGTFKGYLVAIQWYIKATGGDEEHVKILGNKIKELSGVIEKKIKTNALIGEQKNTYLDWEDVIRTFKHMQKNYKKNKTCHTNYAIVSCYVLLPPRRLKDYGYMKLLKNEQDFIEGYNYYSRDNKMFIFTNYKTGKFYKKQSIRIPDRLASILNEFIDMRDISDNLFGVSPPAIQMRLTRTFLKYNKKRVSVNILRHSYITWMKNSGNMNGKEETVSRIMGHSVNMQNDYYKDLDKNSDDEADDFTYGPDIINANLNIVY